MLSYHCVSLAHKRDALTDSVRAREINSDVSILTMFSMELLDMSCKVSLPYNIPIELVPIANGSKLRSGEFRQRMKEQTVEVKPSDINEKHRT